MSRTITVNFNNLRRRAVNQSEDLIKTLSKSIIKEDQWAKPNALSYNQNMNIKGYVLIDASELEDKLNNLLSSVRSIACVYEKENEDFADLSEEIGDPMWFESESNLESE